MLVCLFLLLLSFSEFARPAGSDTSFEKSLPFLEDGRIATEQVEEAYQFSGLAAYFNDVQYYVVSESSIRQLEEAEDIELQDGEWLANSGAFQCFADKAVGSLI